MRNKLLFLFCMLGFCAQHTYAIDLKITITNISALKGKIQMGVFNDEKTFLEKGKEYRSCSQEVTNDTVVIILKDLVKNDYAISLYHDVNSDNECNLNFLGIPLEPFGFSKNYMPISKPSFNDCKITVNQDTSIIINLIQLFK